MFEVPQNEGRTGIYRYTAGGRGAIWTTLVRYNRDTTFGERPPPKQLTSCEFRNSDAAFVLVVAWTVELVAP
ncbi:hypothetical protein ON010_g12594 [Phytophthora cinnamomi]|nr:hypothetical protein ON010_g12594 [Phytophthora cinnamomi]